MQFFIRYSWALAILVFSMAAPLAQNRLIIDVSKVNRPQSTSGAIHYQGTGSVRHSEQRTYEAAQDRRTVQAAEDRRDESKDGRGRAKQDARAEEQRAEGRRTTGAENRHEVQRADDRTYGTATDRYGSVRLDTIR
jgi:hypothetical protein